MNINDLFILGIPLILIVVLYALSFEKRLKTNPYLLILTIITSFGYGGYLLGAGDNFTNARILLILIFFIGGLWRSRQLIKIIKPVK